MTIFKIAFRNIFRNRRRSLMTVLAVSVGAVAVLVFGAFTSYMILSLQTETVRRSGHLAVFRQGYFDFGTGNPAEFGISRYKDLLALITKDPTLKPLIAVVTPSQAVFGIAGNFGANASKTFFGEGIVPTDRFAMRQWDEYGFGGAPDKQTLLDSDREGGLVGSGLARILRLCKELNVPRCPTPPAALDENPEMASEPSVDFSGLAGSDPPAVAQAKASAAGGRPRIDLLAATAGGAPNVVSLYINQANFLGLKEIDDNYVAMNLEQAQRLLYGRGEHKVSAITLQLHRTQDMDLARTRLAFLFETNKQALEIRDFTELTPLYIQSLNFFLFILTFIATIIGVIVLFTIINTMSMSVMERTNEIGTVRALGVQRRDLRWQFVTEGAILGAIGAAAGVVSAALIVFAVNHSGATWSPPNVAGRLPLFLDLFGFPMLIIGTFGGLIVISTVAALIPANRAAKLPVVDALRHI